MNKIFLLAGEQSGDLLGASLMQALNTQIPTCSFYGVGGGHMREQGLEGKWNMEDFSVMGFSGIITALPRLFTLRNQIIRWIFANHPAVVILIDYQEFNMRLAQALRKRGYKGKIVQYVSPSVWAWRPHRANVLASTIDLLLTIFPFEAAYFHQTSLPVKYVGNPVKERIDQNIPHQNWKEELHLPDMQQMIALFPGSRKGEISLNLPKQLAVAEAIKKKHPGTHFGLSCANPRILDCLMRHIRQSTLNYGEDIFIIPPAYTYDLMRESHAALAKSGTVTLELALFKCPTVVMYELSLINYLIAKYCLHLQLNHYCIVNIIAKTQVFPEFYNRNIPASQLAEALSLLINDPQQCKEGCAHVAEILGNQESGKQAASAIKELISS